MCIRKKVKATESSCEQLPRQNPTLRQPPTASETRREDRESAASVNNSTARRNTNTDEDKTQKEYEHEDRKRLSEVYLAIGAVPNDVLAKRLLQRKQVQQNPGAKIGGENLEKFGDITFSYRASLVDDVDDRTQGSQGADTEYEMPKAKLTKTKAAKTPKASREKVSRESLSKEGGKKGPAKGPVYQSGGKKIQQKKGKYIYKRNTDGMNNADLEATVFDPETNFMANLDDMEYVARDMMRTMKKKKIEQLLVQTKQSAKTCPDSSVRFSKNVLRANTFLSNALSLPTHEEREYLMTAKEYLFKVSWVHPPSIEIANFRSDDDIVLTAKSVIAAGPVESADAVP